MTPQELIQAVADKKCVTGFNIMARDRMPAAFVASMQFNIVMRALPHMKVYEPKRKARYVVHAYTTTKVHPPSRWNGVVCGSRGGREGLVTTGHISSMTCKACLRILNGNEKLKSYYSLE